LPYIFQEYIKSLTAAYNSTVQENAQHFTLLHEILHLYGIEHDSSAIMNGNRDDWHQLQDDDWHITIDHIRKIQSSEHLGLGS